MRCFRRTSAGPEGPVERRRSGAAVADRGQASHHHAGLAGGVQVGLDHRRAAVAELVRGVAAGGRGHGISPGTGGWDVLRSASRQNPEL